jgi:hypothetical protein
MSEVSLRPFSVAVAVLVLTSSLALAADSGWVLVASGPAEKQRAEIRAYRPDKSLALQIFPFDDFKKPPAMEITAGDVDGDGYQEIIAAGGRDGKQGAVVRALHHLTKTQIWEIQPYADLKKDDDQIAVAAGDLDGDGNDELIVAEASDSQGPNHLRVFRFQNKNIELVAEFLIADLKNVAITCGDVDGDGKAEVLVSNVKASGKGPDIRILKAQTEGAWKIVQAGALSPAVEAIHGFWIAAGDINGDKKDEILLAFEPRAADGPSFIALDASGKIVLSLVAPFKHKNHVRVSAVDLNNDGRKEILLAHVKPVLDTDSAGDTDEESGLVRTYSSDGKPYPFEVATSFSKEISVAGLTFDLTPPLLTFAEPVNGDVVAASPVKLSGSANEPVRLVRVEPAGSGGGMFSPVQAAVSNRKNFGANVPFPQGVDIYDVVAEDRAGNQAVVRRSIIYEVPGPLTVKITSPAADAVLTFDSLTVRGVVNKSSATVTVNGVQAYPDIQGNFFVYGLPVATGESILHAVARDFSGNKAQDMIKIRGAEPLKNFVTVNPSSTSGDATVTVSFTFQLDPSIRAARILWDRVGAQKTFVTLQTLSGVQETFTEPGYYIPLLVIEDQSGQIYSGRAFVNVQAATTETQVLSKLATAIRKDLQGRLWILDPQGSLHIWDPAARTSREIKISEPAGPITGGSALAIDEKGTVFVLDGARKKVQVLSSDGVWVRSLGEGRLSAPSGLAADCYGDCHVYVADRGKASVLAFDSTGSLLQEISAVDNQKLQAPGILRSQFSFLYILDSGRSFMTSGGNLSLPFPAETFLDIALLQHRLQTAALLSSGRVVKMFDSTSLREIGIIPLAHAALSVEAKISGDQFWYAGGEGVFEVMLQDEDPGTTLRNFLRAWRAGDIRSASEFLSIHNYQENYSQLLSPVLAFSEQMSIEIEGELASVKAVVDGESTTFTLSKDGFNHWRVYQFAK